MITEKEYATTSNLIRVRSMLSIMPQMVLLDEEDELLRKQAAEALSKLNDSLNSKIKIRKVSGG